MDETVFEFDVLWLGWEMDNTAWVKKKEDGAYYLNMTSHGREYKAEAQEPRERLHTYKKVILQTEKALRLLGDKFE